MPLALTMDGKDVGGDSDLFHTNASKVIVAITAYASINAILKR
jgi:hypothetical protein